MNTHERYYYIEMIFKFRIEMMRESGIYPELQKRVINPKSIPEYDLRITQFSNDSEDIYLIQLKVLFYLYLSFNLFSFTLLVVEAASSYFK